MSKMELLSPAGSPEALIAGVQSGADAVYLGYGDFNARRNGKNFTLPQLEEGVSYCHTRGVKVHLTLNTLLRDRELPQLEKLLEEVLPLGIDAYIVQDLAVAKVLQTLAPQVELHASTQCAIHSLEGIKMAEDKGFSRVVLARELSREELEHLASHSPLPLEIFVHGAQCMGYSGHCYFSAMIGERSGNRGLCAQPCRWKYSLVEETRPNEYYPVYEDERGTYIMNSKDLCMINSIDELVNSGIMSFKVEGRMKTLYYVAVTIKTYREAIDTYFVDPEIYKEKIPYYLSELRKVSHRDFTNGFYYNKTNDLSQVYDTNSYIKDWDFVGVVLEYDEATSYATVEQRNKFVVGDEIHFMTPKGEGFTQEITEILNKKKEQVQSAPHPQEILYIKVTNPVFKNDILRKPCL